MKLRAICTIIFEYEVEPENYPIPDFSKERAIAIDLEGFQDNQDMFFELAGTYNATYKYSVEEVK
jgi:hypothetical protein